jgi:CPA2 family monovalent cation:H+ antiporter-2
MKTAEPLGAWLEKKGWGRRKPKLPESDVLRQKIKQMTGHAIIVGHGPVGERLNKALLDQGIPTLVIDLNAETVRLLKRQGQPVLFADAAHLETWELARLDQARMVAFTFPYAPITAEALAIVRELKPEVPVLARARFASDVEQLKRLGAAVVINDELDAAKSFVQSALMMQGES